MRSDNVRKPAGSRFKISGSFWASVGVFFVAAISAATAARAEVEVTLSRAFIEKYKNRITITTDFVIDSSKSGPNPPSKDGDMHIAGRPGKEIGLITVAELQNARNAMNAVKLAKDRAGADEPVRMSGVWRVWFEHAGGANQVQGRPLKKLSRTDTNPDHIFEIHPITLMGGLDLLHTLAPIEDYDKPNNAESRFRMLEGMRAQLKVSETAVTIRAAGNSPNYVRFLAKKLPGNHGYQRANKSWAQPADGMFLFAKVYDADEELLARKRRIGFVKGSEPHRVAAELSVNHCLDLLGITRVNLELISWRAHNAEARPQVLQWNLPYELIAVGVHGGSVHCSSEEDEE